MIGRTNAIFGGSTLQIPLDAPTSFSATAGNAQVELTWTDPLDKYATPEGEVSETGDQLVSEWDHTVLVRKTGSQPAGPDDGTVVVSSSVRNQYQTTPYTDSGLTNDTLYYYGVFAYNQDGVASPGAFVSATPKAGTPLSELTEGTIIKINENGSPVEFYLAKHNYEPALNGEGRELVVRKDCYRRWSWDAGGVNAYASSDIDAWFNGTYKIMLSAHTQNQIGTTAFYYTPGNGNVTLSTLQRAVFALSLTELGRSNDSANVEGSTLPIASILKPAYYNGGKSNQWTRTPCNAEDYSTGEVDTNRVYMVGTMNNIGARSANSQDMGYRPCFSLPSAAVVNNNLALVED